MASEIKYIELKSGFDDNGPAWIGLASFSKSGKTIYFDGKAFKSLSGNGISGNYYDYETGEEYWISGVKKNMADRHWAGGGTINIEERILKDYLTIIGRKTLDNNYKVVQVDTRIPTELHEAENMATVNEPLSDNVLFKNAADLTTEELHYAVELLHEDEINTKYKKARRFIKQTRLEFEAELEKRKASI